MVDMGMEMKFSFNKYSQALYTVGPGYGGMANFIIIHQYVGFPGEGYNFGFTDVEFHAVSNAPTLYRFNVRLKQIAVLRLDGSENFDIVREK
jgi:hypothetical protein